MAPPAWSVRDVKRRARHLREQLAIAASDVVSPDELAAAWPGGRANALPSPACWWWCWGTYISYARRMELDTRRRGTDDALRAAIARRSAREPVAVTLTAGPRVLVHPKGYHALKFLDFLDREHRLAATLALDAEHEETPAHTALQALGPIAESLGVRIWAWVLTHPAADLPFTDDQDQLDPPAWTTTLTAVDLLALARAHHRIHREDLQIIAEAFPPSDTESRLRLEGFLNTFIEAGGYTPFDVYRRFTLGEIFANTVSRAIAAKEASAKPTGPAFAEVA